MKRMLLVVALLALTAAGALAQGDSCIGMFTDSSVSVCNANTVLYTTTSVHFYAILDEAEVPTIISCQFKVDNLPPNQVGGIVTTAWNTVLVIGEPYTDVALAFTTPLAAPHAYLGRLDFFVTNADWIGANHLLEVVAANSQTDVLIVRGSDAVIFPVPGASFAFNGEQGCDCPPIPVGESSWGQIKALY